MKLAGTLLALLVLIAGCGADPGGEAPRKEGDGTTRDAGAVETSVEQISGGQSGPDERGVVVANSAAELAAATGLEVPDSGEGLYVSAHAGERPTGGYRVSLSSAGAGEIRVSLREPGPGDIVTQALTQPYAVAVVKREGSRPPKAGELRFVDAGGEPLGWPVHRAERG